MRKSTIMRWFRCDLSSLSHLQARSNLHNDFWRLMANHTFHAIRKNNNSSWDQRQYNYIYYEVQQDLPRVLASVAPAGVAPPPCWFLSSCSHPAGLPWWWLTEAQSWCCHLTEQLFQREVFCCCLRAFSGHHFSQNTCKIIGILHPPLDFCIPGTEVFSEGKLNCLETTQRCLWYLQT